MVHIVPASPVPDRFGEVPGHRERVHNSTEHRFAGHDTARNARRHPIVHRVAPRSVTLRRVATRRRLARLDPEIAERRAWRLTNGGTPAP